MSEHIQNIETLFRDALIALGAPLAGVLVVTDFSGAEKTLPCVTVKAVLTPLNANFSAFTFSLNALLESTADGTTPVAAHAALVATIATALHGTGKAALLTAINSVGTYAVKGWSAEKAEPSIEQSHFATPVAIGGTALKI